MLVIANIILVIVLFAAVGLTLLGLPGNFLMLAAAAGYGWLEGFVRFDGGFLLGLGGLFLAGEAAEFAAGALGARRAKASRLAVAAAFVGGLAGALAGSLVMPLFGTVAGAVAGAFGLSYLAELSQTGDRARAEQVAKGAAVGLVVGTAFKLAVAVGMAAAVLWRVFAGV